MRPHRDKHITQACLCSEERASQGSVPSCDFFASITLAFASAHIIQYVYTPAVAASMWHTLAHIDLWHSLPCLSSHCAGHTVLSYTSLCRGLARLNVFLSRGYPYLYNTLSIFSSISTFESTRFCSLSCFARAHWLLFSYCTSLCTSELAQCQRFLMEIQSVVVFWYNGTVVRRGPHFAIVYHVCSVTYVFLYALLDLSKFMATQDATHRSSCALYFLSFFFCFRI